MGCKVAYSIPALLGCKEMSVSPSPGGHQGGLEWSPLPAACHSQQPCRGSTLLPGSGCVRHGTIFWVACVRIWKYLGMLVDCTRALVPNIEATVCTVDRPGRTKAEGAQGEILPTSQAFRSVGRSGHCWQASCQFTRESFHPRHGGVRAPCCVDIEWIIYGSGYRVGKAGHLFTKGPVNQILCMVKYQPPAS